MSQSKQDIVRPSNQTPKNSKNGFTHKSEDERLIEDVLRSDIEKLHLFTRMLRRNAALNEAEINKK